MSVLDLFTCGRPEDIDLAVPPLAPGKPSGQNICQIAEGYSKWVTRDWARACNVEYRAGPSGPSVSLIAEGDKIWTTGDPRWPVMLMTQTGAVLMTAPAAMEALKAARWAFSAGPWLIRGGQPCDLSAEITSGRFSGLAEGTPRERAAIGIREDGCLVHIADMSATLAQMRDKLRSRDCSNAISLDGGGSLGVVDATGKVLIGYMSRQVCCALVFRRLVEEANVPSLPVLDIIDPGLKFVQPLMPRAETDAIVLHHADATSCTVQDVHRWHLANGWAGIGYHFFADKSGSVFKGRPVEMIGAHIEGHNGHTVGVCAEGDYAKDEMPQAQRQAIVALTKHLLTLYLGAEVKRHCDLNATLCPGKYYPFDAILAEVRDDGPTWDPAAEIARKRVAELEAIVAEREATIKRIKEFVAAV